MKKSTSAPAPREGKPSVAYRIHLPGVGMFGSYPTAQAAQTAIYYLPISARKRATIHRTSGKSA